MRRSDPHGGLHRTQLIVMFLGCLQAPSFFCAQVDWVLIYVIMIERIECLGDPLDGEAANPCRYYTARCRDENHKTRAVLQPVHWAFKDGVASTHLVRVTKDLRKEIDRASVNKTVASVTGVVHALVADTDTFKPMLNEAEQAAYRIGGMNAVRTLRKSMLPPQPRRPRVKRNPIP